MDRNSQQVPLLRAASRKLVREWGFLRPTIADSHLSAAATHGLIEIGDHGIEDRATLQQVLQVSDAQLDATIRELLATGEILPRTGTTSRGEETFHLTERGRHTLAAINSYATVQAQKALAVTPPAASDSIIESFQLYAQALRSIRRDSLPSPERTPSPTLPAAAFSQAVQPVLPAPPAAVAPASLSRVPAPQKPEIVIVPGYRPGILGRCLEMNMEYYSRHYGWGASFEAMLAETMNDLMTRLDGRLNQAWCAVQVSPPPPPGTTTAAVRYAPEGRIVGTVFIDGEILGEPGVARLRCFIVDEAAQGHGLGRRMMREAMDFVRAAGFRAARLWTMEKLVTARRLYEAAGFTVAGYEVDEKFGFEMRHMIYEWKRPAEWDLDQGLA